MIVGSAASLLEGDELDIALLVEGPVPVVVRSVAAQVAHPCLDGGSTLQRVHLVADGGSLVHWAVEPLIVCAGAEHRNELSIELRHGSRCVGRDVVVLGRSGEDVPAAVLRSTLRVELDGRPLLHDGLDTTLPGTHGPAGLAGHRVLATVGAFGWRPSSTDGDVALAGPGTLRRVVATTASDATSVTERTAERWWSELTSRPPTPTPSVSPVLSACPPCGPAVGTR